jgi:tRNA(Ile)-lysidine synthase
VADLTAALTGHLLALLKTLRDAPRCWVAYSGGLDSTVLLDLTARLGDRLSARLAAVHIDHGLNPGSADWASHCQRRCAGLGVPLVQRQVEVRVGDGQGPEAAARAARYAALVELLGPGDLLLTAHHRDDQAETVLLALLRGAGVRGLAAMPEVDALCFGRLVRPLLTFGRAELHAYAQARGLNWLDDPSNLDLNLDRNWLRQRILPLLVEHWPAASRTLARSARHCAEAAALVDRQAAGEAARLVGQRPGTLSVRGLRGLDAPLCRAVLRSWIVSWGFAVPDTRHVARIMGEVLPARPDASPLVAWAGCEVRRYRDDLFALAPLPPAESGGH